MTEQCVVLTQNKNALGVILVAYDGQIETAQGPIDAKGAIVLAAEGSDQAPTDAPDTVAGVDARCAALEAIIQKYTDLRVALVARDNLKSARATFQAQLDSVAAQWLAAGCAQQ